MSDKCVCGDHPGFSPPTLEERLAHAKDLAEYRSRSIDKLLAQNEALRLRLARAEVTIQDHADQAAWVRVQESTHKHCEGHALCDLLSIIESDAKALE